MKKANGLLKRKWLLLIILFVFSFNLIAQTQIISREYDDYPEAAYTSECVTSPYSGCVIALPPAKIGVNYVFKAYLQTNHLASHNVTFYSNPCSGTDNPTWDYSAEDTFITITIPGIRICSSDPAYTQNYIDIQVEVENSSFETDMQIFRIPLPRKPIKIAMVLDVSESMNLPTSGDNFDFTPRWDVLKLAVKTFVEKFEELRHPGDSLTLSYFNTNVIQPSFTTVNNFIGITTSSLEPISNRSSSIIETDMSIRIPSQSKALGLGLLDAKSKLNGNIPNPDGAKKIVIVFTDGLQNVYPRVDSLDGQTLEDGQKLNDCNPCSSADSIKYYTISIGVGLPSQVLLENIATNNSGYALYSTVGDIWDFNIFFDTQWEQMLYEPYRPDVIISSSTSSPTNNSSININIKFTESVVGFEESDINVTNGEISNFQTVNSSEYTATITSSAEGTIYVSVPENIATNSESNGNRVSNNYSINYDITEPTVVITSTVSNFTNTSPIPVSITFNEEIAGFNVDDISTVNCTLSDFSTSNNFTFTVNVNPDTNGTLSIKVNSDVCKDLAGNNNSESNNFEIEFDNIQPSVAISTFETSPTNNVLIDIQIDFSEQVTGFVISDINFENGDVSNLQTTNSIKFSAQVTPINDGEIIINIISGMLADLAGNLNTESNTYQITFDSTRPAVTLSADNDTTTNAQFNTYVNFSERIIGFNSSEINVTNGNINSLSTSDSIDYVANITATTQGEIEININENKVSDSAGNMNTASDELTIIYSTPTNIDVLKKDGISIYSNNGYVIVEFLKPNTLNFQSAYIEIFSLNGSLIKKEKIENAVLFKTFVNNQGEIYLIKISLDNKIYTSKIQIY